MDRITAVCYCRAAFKMTYFDVGACVRLVNAVVLCVCDVACVR